MEANPYYYKLTPGFDKQVVFPLYMMMTKMMKKMLTEEKFTDEELKEIDELQKKIDLLINGDMVKGFRNK